MTTPYLERLRADGKAVVRLGEAQRTGLATYTRKLSEGTYRTIAGHCACAAGSLDAVLIASKDRYGLPIATYLCRRCSVLWSDPQLDDASLAAFYRDDYRLIYSGGAASADRFFADQVVRGEELAVFVGEDLRTGSRVFDIGCGAGGMLIPFARSGHSVAGCDLDQQYLERGRREGLELKTGNASVLRRYARADLVIASHVLEHLPDPLRHLLLWKELLTEAGNLYVELPGVFRSYERYGDFGKFLQNAHLYHFTLDSLVELCARAGFALVRGDESIRALFRVDTAAKSTREVDPDQILHYLTTQERLLPVSRATRLVRVLPARALEGCLGHRGSTIVDRLGLPRT
jgi:SAM-dependent methyltransferase